MEVSSGYTLVTSQGGGEEKAIEPGKMDYN